MFLIEKIGLIGSNILILDIFSIFSIFSGINVIMVKNPIFSILFLIGLFGSVSLYLIYIGLYYIGLSYIIIYIGAISILFMFILMLIDVRTSELQNDNWNSVPLAIFVSLFISILFTQIFPNYFEENKFKIILNIKEYFKTSLDIIYVSSNSWDSNVICMTHMSSVGNVLYSACSIWLLLSSIILLLAMIGVIVIIINKEN